MSFFTKIFGTPSATSPTTNTSRNTDVTNKTIDAIKGLDIKEQQLEKKRELLEEKMAKEVEKAKELQREKKTDKALMCLKRKKMYENQVQNLANLILKINEQKILLENSQTSAEALNTMKQATEASKMVMKSNNVENVEDVMDAIEEVQEQLNEVYERLGQPTGAMAEIDEDELLIELNGINDEDLDESEKPINKELKKEESLPSVPKTKVKEDENLIDLELEELEAELNAA